MVTCCDHERFRKEVDVDLSEIEKTIELKTLPRDRYLRNSRIVELLGTKAYKDFRASLWQETSYKKLMDKAVLIPTISWYTGKNILAYMAMAVPEYPWVRSLMDWASHGDEEFIAIGPNPAELANLGTGVRRASISKDTQNVFKEIVSEARRFLPTSFTTELSSGQIVEKTLPDECRSGQNLQLNACKGVQIMDIFYTGMLYNPRRCSHRGREVTEERPAKVARQPCCWPA